MPIPTPQRHRTDGKRRLKRWALAVYRLGLILAALMCLWARPDDSKELNPETILPIAKQVFSEVAEVAEPNDGFYPLSSAEGLLLGWATSTFPQAENIQGYSGPSELLVILDTERKVKSVRLLSSSDTDGHVDKVRRDGAFWSQWTNVSEASLGAMDQPMVVSGATLTSEAMARGVAARFGAEGMDQWFPVDLVLADLKKWYPEADRIVADPAKGTYDILHREKQIGLVLRSSRMGVSARGFNGISDVIVALDRKKDVILGIGFLGSRDNEPYVSDVRNEVKYADGFAGKRVDEILAHDMKNSPLLFTSGASYTNHAVVESVREMSRRYLSEKKNQGLSWKTGWALVWIALGVVVGMSKWGGIRRVRTGFAVISVAAGIWLGWMVSQDQLVGWGANGLGMGAVLPLIVLTAAALVIPAFTGKNVYCNRICPHGAAQTLLGSLNQKRVSLPPKLHKFLIRIPWLTLIVIWTLALLGSGIPFAYFEPFETWSTGFTAWIPALVFSVGLVAAILMPQAYCHYGCPTGAMLRFLTLSPSTWTRRDTLAGLLILAAVCHVVL